jgi:hypothetical protein
MVVGCRHFRETYCFTITVSLTNTRCGLLCSALWYQRVMYMVSDVCCWYSELRRGPSVLEPLMGLLYLPQTDKNNMKIWQNDKWWVNSLSTWRKIYSSATFASIYPTQTTLGLNWDHWAGKPVNNCISYSTLRRENTFNSQPKSQTYAF